MIFSPGGYTAIFLVITACRSELLALKVGARDATKHSAMHGQPHSEKKNYRSWTSVMRGWETILAILCVWGAGGRGWGTDHAWLINEKANQKRLNSRRGRRLHRQYIAELGQKSLISGPKFHSFSSPNFAYLSCLEGHWYQPGVKSWYALAQGKTIMVEISGP